MLKPLLFGAAMAVAVPALAQTTGSTNADMNKPGTSSTSMGQTMTPTTSGTASTTSTANPDSGWGTTGSTSGTATSMGAGTSANGTATWNGGSTGFTGQGGPDTSGKTYPMCSRTVRDNCMQRGGRGHHAAHRRAR
jgi:hypothetical protein